MRAPRTRAAAFIVGYATQRALERATAAASACLSSVPGIGSGAMGLTPDAVKASPDYQSARAAYQASHDRLARHNAAFVRTFKRELHKARAYRRTGAQIR